MTATSTCKRGRWYFGAQIGITGSRREPHDLASALFGGNVNRHRPTANPRHLTQFHWQVGGSRAVPVIEAVLPYLRVKRDRAELVVALQEDIDLARMAGDDAYAWLPCDYDPTSARLLAVAEIREMGRHGATTRS